jgi:uncharacterized protein YdiU (UPF0061 family)
MDSLFSLNPCDSFIFQRKVSPMQALPSTAVLALGEDFYDSVKAARFPQHIPRYLNEKEALELGLRLDSEADWIRHLAEFHPFPGTLQEPLALRYHGHQFRHYNPDLGDGRGFLFAQFLKDGRLLDLGTKGSGQTPYSRSGDGRLTLKGAVREALATELLESLGVTTSKTFCFFETGESLIRTDEPSPTRSAVLTRLSHSHIRFGTFQRLASVGEPLNIKKLVGYCLKNYFPQMSDLDPESDETASQFLSEVSMRSAELVAQWMTAGFVHGVLNTDNMNITGESFDYGPYRFLPTYDPEFTAAYFDQQGLYCFGRQPHAVFWNLQQLAEALKVAYPTLATQKAYEGFSETFSQTAVDRLLSRLNLKPKTDATGDAAADAKDNLVSAFFQALGTTQAPFEQCFFDFFSGESSPRILSSPQASIYKDRAFDEFKSSLKHFEPLDTEKSKHPYFQNAKPYTLLIEEIEALWSDIATKNDWQGFEQKIQDLCSFRGIY